MWGEPSIDNAEKSWYPIPYYPVTVIKRAPEGAGKAGRDMEAYESRMNSEEVDQLYDTILSLKTREDCYRFFDDLCTVGEIQVMAQRWMVARMLQDGETFSAITQKTGVSSATITRVRRCLVYGADGYAQAIRRLREKDSGTPPPGE